MSKTKFLPFIPPIAPLVANNIAIATTRYLRHSFYPAPGELFHAHCNYHPIDGKYLCTSRRKVILGSISKLYYKEIGVDSPFTFEEIWCQICGINEFRESLRCDYYEFKRVE